MHTLTMTLEISSTSARELLKLESELNNLQEGPSPYGITQHIILSSHLRMSLGEENSAVAAHSLDIIWDDDIPLDLPDLHSAEEELAE